MSSKKKRREPRLVFNPLTHLAKLSEQEKLDFLAPNHAALSEILSGQGNLDHWRIVANALNHALVMDEQLYENTCRDELLEAMKGHARCAQRHWATGKLGYAGLELQAVKLAFEIHDQQMSQVTGRELDIAMRETGKRVTSKTKHPTVQHFTTELALGKTL